MEYHFFTGIKYILGYSHFCGLKFKVTPATLILRPETSELVEWIAADNKGKTVDILDIGTGSGTPTLLDRIQSNFPGLFAENHIISSFHVKRGKPYPDPYLLALERGGLKPNEAIVVENAPLGVTAGVAAGLFTIAANTGPLKDEVLSQAGANLVFPSIEALCGEWEKLFEALK